MEDFSDYTSDKELGDFSDYSSIKENEDFSDYSSLAITPQTKPDGDFALNAIKSLSPNASGTERLNAIVSSYTSEDIEQLESFELESLQDFASTQYKNGGGKLKLNDDLIGQAFTGYKPPSFYNSEELLKYNEEWANKAKSKLNLLGGVEYQIGKKLYDEVLDNYKTTLDREATGKNTGWFADKLYRFVEGAGTFGTSALNAKSLQKTLQNWTAENPKYDEDLTAKLATGAGQLTTQAGVSLIPGIGTTLGLGLGLSSASNQVYDETLRRTGDEDSATKAMVFNLPTALVENALDLAVISKAGKLVKATTPIGKRDQLVKILKETTKAGGLEATAEVIEGAGSRNAIRQASGQYDEATNPFNREQIKEDALLGGILGGTLGGVSTGIGNYITNKDIEATLNESKKQANDLVGAVRRKSLPDLGKEKEVSNVEPESKSPIRSIDYKEAYKDFNFSKVEENNKQTTYKIDKEDTKTSDTPIDTGANQLPDFGKPLIVESQEEYQRLERQAGVLENDTNAQDKVQLYLQDLGFDSLIKDYGDKEATAIKFDQPYSELNSMQGESSPIKIDERIYENSKNEASPFSPDETLIQEREKYKESEQQRISLLTSLVQNSGIDLSLFTNPRSGNAIISGGFLSKGGKQRIELYNRLFRDTRDAMEVLGHEFGHFADYLASEIEEGESQEEGIGTRDSSLLGKLLKIANQGKDSFAEVSPEDSQKISQEMLNISKSFRPDESTSFRQNPRQFNYRMSAKEIYADFIGAYFTNPDFVKAVAPTAWKTFESSLKNSPDLQNIITEFDKAVADPDYAFQIVRESQEKALEKEKASLRAGAQARVSEVERQKKNQARSALMQLKTFFFNEKAKPIQVLKDLYKKGDISLQEFTERRNELESSANLNSVVKQFTTSTLSEVESRLIKANISDVDFHDYLLSKRIVEESNSFIEFTRKSPKEALALLKSLYPFIKESPSVLKKDKERIANLISEESLTDASAKINQVLSFLPEKERVSLLNEAYKAIDSKDSKKQKSLKVNFLQDVGKDKIFSVRRYLANPFGISFPEAQKRVRQIETKLNPEQFSALEEATKIFNERNWMVMERAYEAGIFSKEEMESFKINKDNYVAFSALKYRDADFRVNPLIVDQAVGTLDAIGNTYTNTIAKMNALLKMAEYQIVKNKIIDIASIAGDVKEVLGSDKKRIPTEQVSARKNTLEKEQNDKYKDLYGGVIINASKKTYLIKKEEGESILYEFEDPFYTNFLNSGGSNPSPGLALGALKFYNKAMLPLRTGINAFFLTRQKFWRAPRATAQLQGVLTDAKLPVFSFLNFVFDSNVRESIRTTKEKAKEYAEFLVKDKPLSKELQSFIPILGTVGKSNTLGYSNLLTPEIEVPASDNYLENLQNSETEVALLLGQIPAIPTVFERRIKEANQFIGKTPLAGQSWRFFGKVFDWINFQNVQQEYLEKFSARDLALKAGKTEAEALAIMRDIAGNPNSTGGGRGAKMLNDYFSYFRPAMNSFSAMAELYKLNPRAYARHQTYSILGIIKNHPVISSLLLSGLVSSGVISEEFAEKFQKGLDMLSRYDKSLNNVTPLFFIDNLGNWVSIFDPDFKAKDVGNNWKVIAFKQKLSFSQEPFARIAYSMLDAISDNNPQDGILKMIAKDFGSLIPGMSPGIESGLALRQFALGENPYNGFTQRGALNEDVYLSGSLVNNSIEMAKYLASKTGFYKYTPYKSADDSMFGGLSAIVKQATNVAFATGNYGLVEQDKANLAREQRTRSQIKSLLPTKITDAYQEYASLKRLGAVNRSTQDQTRYAELTRFMRVYKDYENEIGDFMRRGDSEEVEKLIEEISSDFDQGARAWVRITNKGSSRPKSLEQIKRESLRTQERIKEKAKEEND